MEDGSSGFENDQRSDNGFDREPSGVDRRTPDGYGRETPASELTDSRKSERRVQVDIYGIHYVVVAEDNPDRVLELANRVDQKMRQIAEMNPGLATAKIAILAALNFAENADRQESIYNLVAQRSDLLLKLVEAELND